MEKLIKSWDLWRSQFLNRGIFSTAITVGVCTFIVKLITILKDLLVAYKFGTSDELDSFFIALMLPIFVLQVLADPFASAFMPIFIRCSHLDDPTSRRLLFANITIIGSIALLAVTGLLGFLGPYVLPVLGLGFSAQKLALCRILFFLLLPIILCNGITKGIVAVLNANNKFALPSMSPLFLPISISVSLFFFTETLGIYALALGTVVGFFLEAVVLLFFLFHVETPSFAHWRTVHAATTEVGRQYAPLIAGALFMSGTFMVDQAMAAVLETGSVSLLIYGNKIVAFFLGIVSFALSTAVLPHFSLLVAQKDWPVLRHTLYTNIRVLLLITIPLTIILVYFSEPLVRLLFQRGAFTAADTHSVSRVQVFYSLLIPFYLLNILLARLISSLGSNAFLFQTAILNFFLNILFNYLFIGWLGISGIALSTVFVYVICFGFFLYKGLALVYRSAD